MKKRADLRNALKNANENIEISEDDLNYLIDLFENTTWPLEHEDIISLYDLLQNSL
jgi:CBS-domain-containing membrane protein